MISSIQLRQDVKEELEGLKEKTNESYEDVIVKLLKEKKEQKKEIEKQLTEAYQDEEIMGEWDTTLMDGLHSQ